MEDEGVVSSKGDIAVEGVVGLSWEDFPQETKQQVLECPVKVLKAFEADFVVVVENVDISLTEYKGCK